MENVDIKYPDSQEDTSDTIFETTDKAIPSGEEFFDMLEQQLRDIARITIINTINDEFETFIGAAPYQRSDNRHDSRNGFRYRNFETRFGEIKDIPIPRSRNGRFIPKLFTRWKRRENKITRAIADMFVNGISTRKVKKITKAIWGRSYSATTVSRCNQVLKEEYLKWMNRPISQSIRYLFLDAVNLKIRRHWISKEALLCAIGITEDGKKEFLGFMLGGRESTASWESLLLLLLQRGLSADHLKMVTVDGNAGLLSALGSLLPTVTIQRCIVHKIRNIVGKCPRSLRGVVPAEAKLIFYANSQEEARERFNEFKARWQQQLPQIVECIEKDLDQLIAFYQFPYQHWVKIRSTNVIEQAFKEFRRRIKVMETSFLKCARLLVLLMMTKGII